MMKFILTLLTFLSTVTAFAFNLVHPFTTKLTVCHTVSDILLWFAVITSTIRFLLQDFKETEAQVQRYTRAHLELLQREIIALKESK